MKKVLLAMGLLVLSTASAMATGFADSVTVDTAPTLTVAGIVCTALGGIWGIRKVVKLINRS